MLVRTSENKHNGLSGPADPERHPGAGHPQAADAVPARHGHDRDLPRRGAGPAGRAAQRGGDGWKII
ncbi:hypothetical protein HBB16_13165 [Pseudonocardia sp. MCCB 268]|nr:hypothetical protein [Pseudonocardia cytotoxica]